MMVSQNKKEYNNLINSLAEDFLKSEENANDYLSEIGYDPEETRKESLEFIKKLQKKNKIIEAQRKLQKFKELKSLFVFKNNKLINNSVKLLAGILSGGNELSYNTYYRKLEKLSDNDIRDISEEQEFLDFLDKMDQ